MTNTDPNQSSGTISKVPSRKLPALTPLNSPLPIGCLPPIADTVSNDEIIDLLVNRKIQTPLTQTPLIYMVLDKIKGNVKPIIVDNHIVGTFTELTWVDIDDELNVTIRLDNHEMVLPSPIGTYFTTTIILVNRAGKLYTRGGRKIMKKLKNMNYSKQEYNSIYDVFNSLLIIFRPINKAELIDIFREPIPGMCITDHRSVSYDKIYLE